MDNGKVDFEYFDVIDTKDKAYWLGYLCADGYISKCGYKLVLDLSSKDAILLYRFCETIGWDKSKITERVHNGGYTSNKLIIYSRHMVNSLNGWGCTNNKSFTLGFIDFNNEELDLAYLMGYYDGDGFANSSTICGASKSFMVSIKNKYDLKYDIKDRGSVLEMNLGAELKRKMLTNYPNSLERKRLLYRGDKSYKTMGVSPPTKKKFEVSKNELEELLKTESYVNIGKKFGVSDNAIRKRAKSLGIKLKVKNRRNNNVA